MEQAKALDLLEPLDWKAIDPDPIFDEARQEKAIGYQYYTTLMAWRSDAKPVETWQQFWDVEAFPGKRALPNYPTYALPVALLADGVNAQALSERKIVVRGTRGSVRLHPGGSSFLKHK